jgi:hypothetical protein
MYIPFNIRYHYPSMKTTKFGRAKFVRTKFDRTKFVITKFVITKFVITKFVITKFVITKFVITKFVITKVAAAQRPGSARAALPACPRRTAAMKGATALLFNSHAKSGDERSSRTRAPNKNLVANVTI